LRYEVILDSSDVFINKWKNIYPHYFAYLDFPYQIHRMIYTTNWIERLNKEIRRTQNIRNSFPNLDNAMNLICAHLMDYERLTLKHPITSFLRVQDTLESMLFDCPQTHNS